MMMNGFDLVVSLTFAASALALTQADRDTTCVRKFGAGFQAVLNTNGKYECVAIPPPSQDVCFNEFSNPKGGDVICCEDDEAIYSYDTVSLEGACCLPGTEFSYDATAKSGSCCPKKSVLKCSCTPSAERDFGCPGADRQTLSTGGKFYEIHCDAITGTDATAAPQTTAASFEDCAKQCSNIPSCVGINYKKDDRKCNLKAASSNKGATGNTAYDCAIQVPDPNESLYECPQADGKEYTSGGITYRIQCGAVVSIPTDDIEKIPGSSIKACSDSCSQNVHCQGVNFDHVTSTCYLKGTYNAQIKGTNVNADTAIPITARPKDCPGLMNQSGTTNGYAMKYYCGTKIAGNGLGQESRPSLEDCANACIARSGCWSVDYSKNRKLCYYHGDRAPTFTPNLPSTEYDSATLTRV